METRARKRVRVPDYEYDNEVAERSAKRIKEDKNAKEEPQIKQEVGIKSEASNNNIKSDKNTIKSEVKSEVKIELKKEKKEKKLKLEAKIKIKTEPGLINETTDQAGGSREERSNVQNPQITETEVTNENHNDATEEKFKQTITAREVKKAKGRYHFDWFKTMILHEQVLRWKKPINQSQQKLLNSSIIEKILSFFELPDVMTWTRVAKSTSNLVHASQLIWQSLFRKQHWHLPHEIRNKNFHYESSDKPFPQLEISDEKIDWFNEFKRNFITCKAIRQKLASIHKSYERRKIEIEEYELDEETIQEWEEDYECFLPNDLREYYKRLIFSYQTSQHNLGIYGLPESSECTVTLFRVYRKIKPTSKSSRYEEDDTVTDLQSLSKLLDIPEEDLDDDITGILLMDVSRNGATLFVPYINMFMAVEGDEPAVVRDHGEHTVLQRIERNS